MNPGVVYKNPPIVEVILDIQVDPRSEVSANTMSESQHRLISDYPKSIDIIEFTRASHYGPEAMGATAKAAEHVGYTFSTVEGNRSYQAKRGGFTFNWLKAYPGWPAYSQEARRVWDEYVRVAKPKGFKAISLRYINKFDFVETRIDMAKYFRTYINISSDLSQTMRAFFCQATIPIDETDCIATLTQTAIRPEPAWGSTILLDINLSKNKTFVGDDAVWEAIAAMRVKIVAIFESCITDSLREVIL